LGNSVLFHSYTSILYFENYREDTPAQVIVKQGRSGTAAERRNVHGFRKITGQTRLARQLSNRVRSGTAAECRNVHGFKKITGRLFSPG
jgi:hypothetical protein